MIQRREFLAATAGGALAAPPAAPDAKAVRVGIVGVGKRGTSLLRTLLDVPGAEVAAAADIDDNALARAQKICLDVGRARPEGFARGPQDFRRMLERKDLDAVLVATPWEWHAPMLLAAMDAGKYAATEVPAAVTLEECEALVEKNQRTGRRATMLENWVYRREPLAVVTMARAGLLGEIVHCESGYGHDVRLTKFRTAGESRRRGELAWRGEHSTRRNGNLYPTHQFAPAAMLMDVNHGVRIERLVAMGSLSRGMNRYAADLWGDGHALAGRSYRNGDRTTVLLQLSDGRAITQFHQTQSWHPRDDGHKYLGTKGMVRWPFPDKGSIWVQDRHWDRKTLHAPKWHPLDPFLDEFDHPLWKAFGREARAHASAHDGSDWLELRGFIESVRHGTEPPVPMEDAVTWSAIAPLSEKSIAGGSAPVAMPDFTRGKWKSSPKFELKWSWA